VINQLQGPAAVAPKNYVGNHDTAKFSTKYFLRKKLVGDFNGDGKTEILYESLMSRKNGKQIDSVVFNNYYKGAYSPYDGEVDVMFELDPVLKLKSVEGINSKKLNHTWQVFGILEMINLGDINENLGDEIALIINWADWSSINCCQIYSYCNEKWLEVFWFEIHEGQLDYHPRKSHEITNTLECKKGQWLYRVEDQNTFAYKWKKLNSCSCKPN